jgi:hypothetical protein
MVDLTWHLVSSVSPADWDTALVAYGDPAGFLDALPSAVVQGLLSFAFEEEPDAGRRWVERLREAARRLG